jgi:N-glycosylase/DNA lyase
MLYGNLVKIRAAGSDPSGGSRFQFAAATGGEATPLEPLLRRFFRLDDDIDTIYAQICRDPRVAEMVGRYRGLRLLRVESWECLISFMCSANSNLARIHANVEAMAEAYGRPRELEGQVGHTLPGPGELAEVGEARLRALGLGFRAPYVASAARAVAEGALDLESLRYVPYKDAQARLMELPGIGPKIADCVLLHSLDKLEAFPVDVWVRRALREWYFAGRRPLPDREMAAWARSQFGPYAGYAELYLFHGRRLQGRGG